MVKSNQVISLVPYLEPSKRKIGRELYLEARYILDNGSNIKCFELLLIKSDCTAAIRKRRPEFKFPAKIEMAFSQIQLAI